MMGSRGLFGWSPPHVQPLTMVSVVSEPHSDAETTALLQVELEEEMEPPPAAIPFCCLFACADGLDWFLMVIGSIAAAAHGTALVVYLHYFAKVIHHMHPQQGSSGSEEQFHKLIEEKENQETLRLLFAELMAVYRIAIGTPREATHPAAFRAAFAEFFSMLIFVFAGQGSGMAYTKITNNGPATPDGLIVASLSHAFGLFVAVSVGANISCGHVNPAVTFGAFVGGNITLLRSILYWIAQLLGSVVACILLNLATGGMETSAFSLSSGVSVWNALVFEIVMTFGLVYTVYATAVDPKKGNVGVVAPIAIGFIVGANILVGGAFDGASMNPAVSFGPALVSWTWTHHWVYWLGPFIGSAAAAILYDNIFIGDDAHQPLSNTEF